MSEPSSRVVRVSAVRQVGPDAVAIEIEAPAEFDARPGQFVKLSAPALETSRFYSLSSPDVEDTLEVTVAVDPDGTLGPWLADREAGDEVEVAGPFGNTYYDGEDRVVVLAGGPGVGPAVGIAERALAAGNEAAVVYRDDAPMHEDRLAALSSMGATVALVGEAAERADVDGADLAADAADVAAPDAFDAAVAEAVREGGQVFVYGFADFLDVATDALAAAGYDPDAAKVENFG
ncbi:MAG: FAD-dependent oxidoreductase [Halobacteriaceae archaeon]